MFEGIALHGQFPFHRTVIDGAQVAHVKRGGVRADIDAFQKGLVFHHQVGVHFLEQQVPFAPETQKTVQGGRICFGRAPFAYLFQFLYELSCKGKETATVGRRGEHFYHLVGGISRVGTFEPCDDAPEPGQVVCYGGLHGEQVIPASLFCAGSHHDLGNAGIPFRRKKPVAGMQLSYQTVVNHLIVERAFLHLDGRGPEFNFYCCHIT